MQGAALAVAHQLHAPEQAAAAHVANHLVALVQIAQAGLEPRAQRERALGQSLAAQHLEHREAPPPATGPARAR